MAELDDFIASLDAQDAQGVPGPQSAAAPAKTLDDFIAGLEAERPIPGVVSPKSIAQTLSKAPGAESVQNLARGFNEQLANTLGFPVEVVNEAMGLAGYNFLKQPGNAQKAIRDAFDKLGFNTKPAEGLMAKAGRETLKQALIFAGMRVAAPSLAGGAATSVELQAGTMPERAGMQVSGETMAGGSAIVPGAVSTLPATTLREGIAREMGALTLNKPVSSAVAQVGAVPGMVGGKYVGELGGDAVGALVTDNPNTREAIRQTGGALGEMGGGVLTAGTALGVAGKAGALKGEAPPKLIPDEGLLSAKADPKDTRYFAVQQVKRELDAVDKGINDQIAVAAGRNDLAPPAKARWLRAAIGRVEASAREIEDAAWEPIPQNAPINVEGVYRLGQRMLREPTATPNNVPGRLLGEFNKAVEIRDADGNVTGLRELPFRAVRELRTSILREERNLAGSTPNAPMPNRDLATRYNELQTAVLDSIDNSLPGEAAVAWEQARAISQHVNDRFSRGPIGELLGRTRQGAQRMSPEETTKYLLDNGGVAAINRAGRPLGLDVGPHSARQPEGVREMRDATAEAIRGEFVAAAREAGAREMDPARKTTAMAKGASAFTREVEGKIEGFTRATRTIRQASEEMLRLAQQRRDWEDSALARLAGKEADAAIRGVLSGGNTGDVAAEVQAIVRSIGGDEAAMAGFKRGLVSQFLTENPSAAQAAIRLSAPRYQKAFETALGSRDLLRFQQMLEGAAAVEGASPSLYQRAAYQVGSLGARIFGLHFGHAVHQLVGGGTAGSLSLPARMSQQMATLVEDPYKTAKAADMLADALFHPKMEGVLRSRLPGTIAEAAKQTALLRRLAVAEQVAYDRAVDRFMVRYRRPVSVEFPNADPGVRY